jgi:hypothetical protein
MSQHRTVFLDEEELLAADNEGKDDCGGGGLGTYHFATFS